MTAETFDRTLPSGGTVTLTIELDWLNAPLDEIELVRDVVGRLRGEISPERVVVDIDAGKPPAAPKAKSEQRTSWACCGQTFSTAQALGSHRRHNHPKKSESSLPATPPTPRRPATTAELPDAAQPKPPFPDPGPMTRRPFNPDSARESGARAI